MTSPFVQPPINNLLPHASILICGSEGVGKKLLGKCLVEYKDPTFQVYVFTSIFLREVNTENQNHVGRSRLDLILLQVDLTNRASLEHLKNSLEEVDISFFFGRLCVVANRVGERSSHSITVKDLEDMVFAYHRVPIIYIDLPSYPKDNKKVWLIEEIPAIPRILNLAKNAVHYHHGSRSFISLNLSSTLLNYI
ncbi:hypothetical protein DSO57_1038392 [Entomophthora muscae]|uniref:Uncharacterized protein n=1 Tax=Entomophthora muscae TaxID=34485 RepID=A0ACC2S0U7_9FUNG|nr:hypothetical protein DSO57_1038392 [Entomophthora muscae]